MQATLNNTKIGDLIFNRAFDMTAKVVEIKEDELTVEILDSGSSRTFRKGSVTGVLELKNFDKVEELKAVYANLRKMNTAEYSALHKRINMKQELLNCCLKMEEKMGRVPSSNIKANIGLKWSFIFVPFYREARNLRWKDLQN